MQVGKCIMNYSRLENNIVDIIKEEQIKLGYRSESIRLYYPLSSLNRLIGCEYNCDQMSQQLLGFSDYVEERMGKIGISHTGERFCLIIPPKGMDYVHEHMDGTEFICDFIRTIEKHDCTIDDILQQFYKHSKHVHVEKVNYGEFDYLIYFEDGKPDDFRYCITDEGCHMIYHRFTVDDYKDFNHFNDFNG